MLKGTEDAGMAFCRPLNMVKELKKVGGMTILS
jgi:hypothetical protein